jgi:hypothetical protein
VIKQDNCLIFISPHPSLLPEGEGAIPFYDTLQGEKARIREYKIE